MLRSTLYLAMLAFGLLAHVASAQAQEVDRCLDQRPGTMMSFYVPPSPRPPGAPPVKRIDQLSRYGFEWNTRVYKIPNRPFTFCNPVVKRVVKGSNAALAGLLVNDTILLVDGEDARRGRLFRNLEPGTSYIIRVRRGDQELELHYTMGTATFIAGPD